MSRVPIPGSVLARCLRRVRGSRRLTSRSSGCQRSSALLSQGVAQRLLGGLLRDGGRFCLSADGLDV